MKTNKLAGVVTIAAVLMLALMLALPAGAPSPATAAPMPAVVTPVANANLSATDARVAGFFNGEAITEDTRRCFDLAAYELLDVQYVIDQTDTNTTTLTLQYSNDNTTFESGPALVSANAADANSLAQYALFGRYNCVYADVANTNTVTITVIGVAK